MYCYLRAPADDGDDSNLNLGGGSGGGGGGVSPDPPAGRRYANHAQVSRVIDVHLSRPTPTLQP